MTKRFIAIAAILLFLSASAFADGMVIRPCREYLQANDAKSNTASFAQIESWCPLRQSRQSAIINHENGYENLLIFVNTQESVNSEKFVWIFPVPANPNQIQIDNLKSFPSFSGTELKSQFKGNINGLAIANFVAVFPPAALLWVILGVTSFSAGTELAQAIGKGEVDRGYEIWQHIDKYGIATELMTAWDSAKFYHYLEVRGTNLSPEAKQLIEEYVNKPNYSFVVSWISNPEEYRQAGNSGYDNYYYNREPIGVFARFPTEKIFYPMRLTSIYQDQYLPVNIDLVGFVQPEIYSNISKETKVEFYSNDRLQYGLNEEESAKKVFNGSIPASLKFTRISINAQAKYFIQDLEFGKNIAVSAILLDIINALWLLIAIIIFFLLSFAAVALTNKLVLESALDNKKIALLAAANFLTIFGYIVAVFLMKETTSEKEKSKFSRLRAILVFWPIFFGIAIAFGVLAIIINILIV